MQENQPSARHIIVARGLTKSLAAQCVVKGIDLAIPYGGCFGLLGPNGAGKTTTLRMILGQSPVSAGSLAVFGRPIASSIYRGIDQIRKQVDMPCR